jgi:hypothetical protein
MGREEEVDLTVKLVHRHSNDAGTLLNGRDTSHMENVLVLWNKYMYQNIMLLHSPSENSQKLTYMGGGIQLAALNRLIDKMMGVLPWSLGYTDLELYENGHKCFRCLVVSGRTRRHGVSCLLGGGW